MPKTTPLLGNFDSDSRDHRSRIEPNAKAQQHQATICRVDPHGVQAGCRNFSAFILVRCPYGSLYTECWNVYNVFLPHHGAWPNVPSTSFRDGALRPFGQLSVALDFLWHPQQRERESDSHLSALSWLRSMTKVGRSQGSFKGCLAITESGPKALFATTMLLVASPKNNKQARHTGCHDAHDRCNVE